MTNLQNTVKRRGIIVLRKCFAADYQCDILHVLLWIRAKTHCGQKYGQFLKHSHRPFIYRFPLVYLCVSCKQHSEVFTEKFLLNQITTHKKNQFRKYCNTLQLSFSANSYSAYHQNDTGALTLKLSLYPIMAQKMADLQNSVTRL